MIKIILIFAFLTSNIIFYSISDWYTENKLKIIKETKINFLKNSYEQVLFQFDRDASIAYDIIIKNKKNIELLEKAVFYHNNKNEIELNKIREKIYDNIKKNYQYMKRQGILQVQFVFKDNFSFLRMHKPDKYGDDLTNIRHSFVWSNKNSKIIKGFEQGKTAHGFRYVYPVYDFDNNHIITLEISFGSEYMQKIINKTFNIHTHFIIRKDVFNTKIWKLDDVNYIQSIESKKYMFAPTKSFNKNKFYTIKTKINKKLKDFVIQGMKKDVAFSLFTEINGNYKIITFLPIKNIENSENVAYIVSYSDEQHIAEIFHNKHFINIMFLAFSLFFFFLMFYFSNEKIKHKEKERLIKTIIDNTNSILFITNFKDIKFANNRFYQFFGVNNTKEFCEKNSNIEDIFIEKDGFISNKMLNEEEDFIDLINRTKENERVVAILDKNHKTHFFFITLSKTNYEDYEIITLTDITAMGEKNIEIKEKAYIDSLTGAYNRYKLSEFFEIESTKSIRNNESLTMAIFDIDHFKKFNDTYGHAIGDDVLKLVVDTVKKYIHGRDFLARYGGEEFIIFLPETSIKNGEIATNNLRKKISEINLSIERNITVSFGVSEYKKEESFETLFKRCDKALYNAKNNGRNRVEIA